MAVFVLRDAVLMVNSVNLSAYVTSITLNYDVDQIETTAMGATGHVFTGGIQNVTLDVSMNQDFAASTVAATLDAILGTPTTVTVKPTSAATSATNPLYTITNTTLFSVQPVSGDPSSLSTMSVQFVGGTIAKTTV